MAGVSDDDQVTSVCGHCDRAIPSSNIDLHFAHCSRNLEKCKVCGDMIPRKHAEEHFLSTHAPVCCSLCSETMDRDILDVHKGENCPKRIVTCEYCEFPLPAIDLLEHQVEVCGNRTELCYMCHKYIRLREMHSHVSRCTGPVRTVAESSRNTRALERERAAGSLFFQRKPGPTPVN
ncbi:TRAF-type zinc finger domain-containing protein 1-like isoform X4 [Salvia hispanica]|uniref:TRAF-type zinc finger domain-containing protein 1-like isoform X4 n=1 Tax=Salvia hispanica TaxID=49212 RepID=UPI00200964C4|nr:TRAF-type zinc finger domain-containing protein 1-like isoform X4 [Salvia hispanica]